MNPITPHQSAPPLVHQGHTRRLATLRPDNLECFETHCHDAGHSECPCRVTKPVLENPSQKWLKNGILSLGARIGSCVNCERRACSLARSRTARSHEALPSQEEGQESGGR